MNEKIKKLLEQLEIRYHAVEEQQVSTGIAPSAEKKKWLRQIQLLYYMLGDGEKSREM